MSKEKKRQRNQVNDAERANRILQITPRSNNQGKLIRCIRGYDQTFAIGPAGTGKTYVATVEACAMYLRGTVKKLVLTRPAVHAGGEDYGFLPGGINQKMQPWLIPIMEIIEECLGKGATAEAMKAGDIEIAPFGFMRGRTFKDCFVLLDEAQNTTPEQMQLFLTRLGEGARVVVSGDLKQSDIGKNSGLKVAMDKIKQHNIPAGVVEFTAQDCVRSELCKMWVAAFEEE